MLVDMYLLQSEWKPSGTKNENKSTTSTPVSITKTVSKTSSPLEKQNAKNINYQKYKTQVVGVISRKFKKKIG